MEEKEYSNVYAIPANYTDSGKLLGGMVETRNAVEAVFLVILLGYPELMWIPMSTTIRIVVMTVTLIPLGVAMELPEGYEALVVPRSSTFKKMHILLANSIGIIDESYKGDNDEWHFPALAMRDTFIRKNERICQFRIIQHQPLIQLKEVEHLGNEDRGGLGSTGRM